MKKLQTTYYFGDLCYVFNHENWNKICSEFDDFSGIQISFVNDKNKEVFLSSTYTAFGDGCYPSFSYNNDIVTIKQLVEIGVDSGTIGFVKIEDCDVSMDEILENKLGIIFEVEEDADIQMKVLHEDHHFYGEYHEIFITKNGKKILSVVTAEPCEDDEGGKEYYYE